MNVYLIRHDVDNFKFYLQDESDFFSVAAFDFCGESLFNGWKPYKIELFKGKTKAERLLKGDFNSSCFSSGLLYVEHSLADVLSRQVNNIELLKVITSDDCDFYYANVVGKIPALHYNNRQELQIMSRTQEYKFNNSINEMLIFRDEILPSNYFVTDRFVDIFQNDFRGVIFKKVGEI